MRDMSDPFYKITVQEQMDCLIDNAIYGNFMIEFVEDTGVWRRVPPDEWAKAISEVEPLQ